MSSTFNASMAISLVLNEMVSTGVKAGNVPAKFLADLRMATGTTDGQVNKGYYRRYTGIAASTITSIDLIGTLTDLSGTTISFDEVVLIAIRNLSDTAANYLEVGPHGTNGFGALASNRGFWKSSTSRSIVSADATTAAVGGGGFLILYAPAGVPAVQATSDILSVETGGSASGATFEILILGRDN
jgi:hypothetical protein